MTLKSPFAAALILAALSTSCFAGDKLNASELRGLAPGSYAVSIYGLVKMTVSLRSGGTISGTTSKKKSDTGIWSVNGEKLCIRFNRWLKGKQRPHFPAITAPIPVAASTFARFKRFPPKIIALKRPFRCPEGPFSLCFASLCESRSPRVCRARRKGFR